MSQSVLFSFTSFHDPYKNSVIAGEEPNPYTSWRSVSRFPKSVAHSRSASRISIAYPTLTVTPVAAAGGGVLTGRILSGQGGGNFTVTDAGSGVNVIAMLDSGKADAAIFVGAAPLPNIEKLDKSKYKLLPIGESIAGHVGNVYRPVKIN